MSKGDNTLSLDALRLQIITETKNMKKPIIVAVSGFGGSGKSTIAKTLVSGLNASLIGVDSFYNPIQEDYCLWEVMDYCRLENEVIIPFINGSEETKYGEYNWDTGVGVIEHTLKFKDILVIEGVGLFRPQLNHYFTYKIWVDCPFELATARGKLRDKNEYNILNDSKWDGIWKRNDLEYYNAYDPKANADYLINNAPLLL